MKLLLITIFLAAIAVICILRKRSYEGFGQVLGAAGPYAPQYVQCLNECNREDPGDRLSGANNLTCGYYCDAVISKIVEQNPPPHRVKLQNNLIECENECNKLAKPGDTHNDIRKCISTCYGAKEVSQWCEELWCPYSTFPHELCMNMCTSSKSTNNNQNAWTWGRFG